ncbi:hypothetical protein D3C85_1047120 [compost metagenome]
MRTNDQLKTLPDKRQVNLLDGNHRPFTYRHSQMFDIRTRRLQSTLSLARKNTLMKQVVNKLAAKSELGLSFNL